MDFATIHSKRSLAWMVKKPWPMTNTTAKTMAKTMALGSFDQPRPKTIAPSPGVDDAEVQEWHFHRRLGG